MIGAGAGIAACITSVICGAGAVATVAGTTLIGATAGGLSYRVAGGEHLCAEPREQWHSDVPQERCPALVGLPPLVL